MTRQASIDWPKRTMDNDAGKPEWNEKGMQLT